MAGSTNFQVWNTPQNNQESDAQYTSDSLRTSGAAASAILPSATANKLFHQTSILAAAITTALANKGYVCSDGDVNALAAVFSNLVTQSDLRAQAANVTYSPNPVFDASMSTSFEMTLYGNVTSSTLVNVRPGDIITFQWVQGNSGGDTVQYPSNVANPAPIETQARTVSLQSFRAAINLVLLAYTPLMVWSY